MCGNWRGQEMKSMLINNTIQIGNGLQDIKSEMKMGNIILYTTKKFNVFQKKMWKLFFGVSISKYKS